MGDTLTYTIITQPAKGLVANHNDGTFTFDPDGDFSNLSAGQSEVVTFTYKATDSLNADSAVQMVGIVVRAPATGPRLDIVAYRPYASPFLPTRVPEATEDTVGAGVRSNFDDDNRNGEDDWSETWVNNENDLIRIDLNFGMPELGVNYYLRRSNASIKVWGTNDKFGVPILNVIDEVQLTYPTTGGVTYYVEWVNPTREAASTVLTLEARNATTNAVVGTSDSIRVFRFTSVVIVIGGNFQTATDPPKPQHGIFVIGKQLYEQDGYDVHMFNHGDVKATGEGPAYNEIENAIQKRRVTQLSVIGYSWGGGATHDVVQRVANNVQAGRLRAHTISFTAYIDAVQHSGAVFNRVPEDRLPPTSAYHVNYYERRSVVALGMSLPASNENINVNDQPWGRLLDHISIDDDVAADGRNGREVLRRVRAGLVARVER